ncbi:MAG: hypothetical protein R3C99_16235 [Pirellulaceae bacterium]
METTLHRQLKLHYAPDVSACEVTLGSYRIDVMGDGELIEIQHGSLAAIRDKVADLLGQHRVRVVKPIVIRKRLVKLQRSARRGQMAVEPEAGKPAGSVSRAGFTSRVCFRTRT